MPNPLPTALTRAWTAELPGEPVPPGPRVNRWAVAGSSPVAPPHRLADLLDGLWHDGGPHRLPDGSPSSVMRRPVPSAGGAYPVQTHVIIGTDGLDGLPPGSYVFDREAGTLWSRPGRAPTHRHHRIGFTIQPGRTFSRYRHRAWPLWIADVAYAVAAVEFLLDRPVSTVFGPGAAVRTDLDVPAAGDVDAWLSVGLVPELALAVAKLPGGWSVDAGRRASLRGRRSPDLHEFEAHSATRGHVSEDVAAVASLSGQYWVLGADHVDRWEIDLTEADGLLGRLWTTHLEAARLVYRHCVSEYRRCRPVSGMSADGGRWMVHAVASLDSAYPADPAGEEKTSPDDDTDRRDP